MPIDEDTDDIKVLVAMTEEELLRRLAQAELGKEAFPMDPRDLLERGRRLLNARIERVQGAICGNSHLRAFAEGKNDTAEIALEILKYISALAAIVAPVTLSALIAKRGLRNICRAHWGS